IMADLHASRVAMQGMRVFSQAKKAAMYDYVLHHAVNLACDRGGYTVLKQIINDWCALGHFFYRDQLLYIVALNAFRLSYDPHGNYVVQHALRLNDLRCTQNVSVSLSGHCFGLSFTKLGSYVVGKLLDTEEAGEVVVGEFLWCYGESLVQLARSEFGSFVVWKALRVMQERNGDLFWRLVNKFMPFIQLLRGHRIGTFLDSLC
ncbi:PREDICTED: putative pumilio homolog 19, partial [Brassica oleracea var. oleracea]